MLYPYSFPMSRFITILLFSLLLASCDLVSGGTESFMSGTLDGRSWSASVEAETTSNGRLLITGSIGDTSTPCPRPEYCYVLSIELSEIYISDMPDSSHLELPVSSMIYGVLDGDLAHGAYAAYEGITIRLKRDSPEPLSGSFEATLSDRHGSLSRIGLPPSVRFSDVSFLVDVRPDPLGLTKNSDVAI